MFNSVYINPRVQFHLQNALTQISVMRDPRASRNIVSDKVWQKMPLHPEIGGQYRIRGQENEQDIRDHTKLISRKKSQRAKRIIKEYRDDYFYHRPTWDIEKQVREEREEEEEEEEEEYLEPAIDLQIPEWAQLAEILCKQAQDLSPEKFHELRIQAAELMVSLCDRRETKKRDAVRRRPPAEVIMEEESSKPDLFPLLMERTTFKYCRPVVMCNHFDRKHVPQLKGADRMSCNHPLCRKEGLEFKHLRSFQEPRREGPRR
ncbi:FluG domain-containing protein [Corynascus similis CBS 632.67]